MVLGKVSSQSTNIKSMNIFFRFGPTREIVGVETLEITEVYDIIHDGGQQPDVRSH
jgi:hypothetical protein